MTYQGVQAVGALLHHNALSTKVETLTLTKTANHFCQALCFQLQFCKFSIQWPVQVNGYDLVGALDMLAQLESEQTGQRKQFLQVWLFSHSKLSTWVVPVKLIQAKYRLG